MAQRKLKVFKATFGFHESVVAAPSQAAALEAWGTHQNLFAEGLATITSDAGAIADALAQPGVPLRRAVGSADRFALTAKPPSLPPLPREKAAKQPPPKPHAPKAPPSTPPDRSRLDAAERALARVDERWRKQVADIDRRRAALNAEGETDKAEWNRERKEALAKVEWERIVFQKAGGAP